jgi:hypothetical protein
MTKVQGNAKATGAHRRCTNWIDGLCDNRSVCSPSRAGARPAWTARIIHFVGHRILRQGQSLHANSAAKRQGRAFHQRPIRICDPWEPMDHRPRCVLGEGRSGVQGRYASVFRVGSPLLRRDGQPGSCCQPGSSPARRLCSLAGRGYTSVFKDVSGSFALRRIASTDPSFACGWTHSNAAVIIMR